MLSTLRLYDNASTRYPASYIVLSLSISVRPVRIQDTHGAIGHDHWPGGGKYVVASDVPFLSNSAVVYIPRRRP